MFRQASEHCQFRRRRFHPANIGDDMFSEAGATNPINAIVTGDGHSGLNPHFTSINTFPGTGRGDLRVFDPSSPRVHGRGTRRRDQPVGIK